MAATKPKVRTSKTWTVRRAHLISPNRLRPGINCQSTVSIHTPKRMLPPIRRDMLRTPVKAVCDDATSDS